MRQVAKKRVDSKGPDTVDIGRTLEGDICKRMSGLMGEYMFARYYGLDIEQIFATEPGEADGGVDFRVTSERTDETVKVDVKTRVRNNADLLFPTSHEIRSDAYFLLERNIDVIDIIGWTSATKLENAEVYGKPFPTETRMVKRQELNSPPEPWRISPA